MNATFVNNWHAVWNKRRLPLSGSAGLLQALIAVDGFDTPFGLMEEAAWRTYIDTLAKRADITSGESVFEVGCGSGAFLFPFHEAGHEVAGIDYSDALIEIARSAMPARKDFLCVSDAASVPPEPPSDVVIANHVFHYFPSLEYARTALEGMMRKAGKVVALTGLPNIAVREESEKFRRATLTEREYEEKYRGLEILYFARQWFSEVSASQGFEIEFFEHGMPGFAQNPFRFDCILRR